VRIALPDAPPVDVQITDRAGQVQVAVRTQDPGLQASLRQDLGTLVNSLERSGYRTEAFTPREGAPQAAASSPRPEPGFGERSGEHFGEHSGEHSGEQGNPSGKHGSGNQGQPSSPQQGQRRRPPQNWIETMEKTA
jgi:arylsulfatase A-like enzyme